MKYIIGNWKMNMLPNEAINFLENYTQGVKGIKADRKLIICVPFIDMFYSNLYTQETNVKIGAQNMHFKTSGAYTGEVSGEMLSSINIEYSIIGHSERRMYFGETDEIVNLKVKHAIELGINPIVCVGEELFVNEEGKTLEFVENQIREGLKGLENLQNINNEIIIAYEPIWAIGTGKTCDSEYANTVNGHIRKVAKEMYPNANISVLYGGSVKSQNAEEILSKEHIDGVLVGGASLDSEEFIKISKAGL